MLTLRARARFAILPALVLAAISVGAQSVQIVDLGGGIYQAIGAGLQGGTAFAFPRAMRSSSPPAAAPSSSTPRSAAGRGIGAANRSHRRSFSVVTH